MADCQFDLKQLDDYTEELLSAIKLFPKETKRFMKSEATTLSRRAKKRAKSTVKQHTGNYVKGFKPGKEVYEFGDSDFNIQVKNTSAVGGFIENGHQLVGHLPDKERIGFVPGYHILENTAIAYESEFVEHVATKLVKKIEEALG